MLLLGLLLIFHLIDDNPVTCQKIVSYFDRIFENKRIAKNKKLNNEDNFYFYKGHSFAIYQFFLQKIT
ncbi:MAG: hypothetical protein CMP11_02600 [Zetaproteobacteria bacterium]|nr:hypothetical protein [Pseudobdellovibrionaceae bacterium]